MSAERLLDVSELAPPEPLERALAAADGLGPGEYLRMRHRREPCLLFPELEARGFRYLVQPGTLTAYEIFIWRRDDAAAEAAVGRIAPGA